MSDESLKVKMMWVVEKVLHLIPYNQRIITLIFYTLVVLSTKISKSV
jgi:hypothetical protein